MIDAIERRGNASKTASLQYCRRSFLFNAMRRCNMEQEIKSDLSKAAAEAKIIEQDVIAAKSWLSKNWHGRRVISRPVDRNQDRQPLARVAL
jgi:hypothetical protein